MRTITLLTDFGTGDYYVGAIKGTLLRLAPEARIVDLSHDLPPGDVEAAAFVLAAAAPAFPAGTVHLAVVDPGVGSARHRLVLSAHGQRFVAPDNGLLTHLLAAGTVHAVARDDLDLPAPGATFHGRDRFAPVAAALAGGLDRSGWFDSSRAANGPPCPAARRSGRRGNHPAARARGCRASRVRPPVRRRGSPRTSAPGGPRRGRRR